MAKRKRLTVPEITPQSGGAASGAAPETKSAFSPRPAPIASVAGEASAQAALNDLADAMQNARKTGRLVEEIPLTEIAVRHLTRDRLTLDFEEMDVLKSSIRARGQQTPIEVVRIDDGAKRYGLISGFRRYMAISALRDETGAPAFATIKALVKPIETVSDRYVAMVEENEIRLNLSFYERAKLAAEAARMGVYPDPETAVRTLFAAATPAKRSKILSFVRLHDALGDVLRYPAAIPEKLGLKLVAAISEDPRRLRRLKETLRKNIPDSPDKERAALDRALAKSAGPDVPKRDVIAGVRLDAGKGRVVLSGKGVTPTLIEDLEAWLKARGADDACLSHAKIRSL